MNNAQYSNALFVGIVVVSVLLLDMLIYWQHRLFHTVPFLWRFHKMHHADSHVDTTTGLRFHPVEIAISLGVKALAVAILGIPAIAIVIFEVALNGFALFNHANVRLPQKWDDRIGWVLITQRLHRIHHSQAKNRIKILTMVLAYLGGTGFLIALPLERSKATKHFP